MNHKITEVLNEAQRLENDGKFTKSLEHYYECKKQVKPSESYEERKILNAIARISGNVNLYNQSIAVYQKLDNQDMLEKIVTLHALPPRASVMTMDEIIKNKTERVGIRTIFDGSNDNPLKISLRKFLEKAIDELENKEDYMLPQTLSDPNLDIDFHLKRFDNLLRCCYRNYLTRNSIRNNTELWKLTANNVICPVDDDYTNIEEGYRDKLDKLASMNNEGQIPIERYSLLSVIEGIRNLKHLYKQKNYIIDNMKSAFLFRFRQLMKLCENLERHFSEDSIDNIAKKVGFSLRNIKKTINLSIPGAESLFNSLFRNLVNANETILFDYIEGTEENEHWLFIKLLVDNPDIDHNICEPTSELESIRRLILELSGEVIIVCPKGSKHYLSSGTKLSEKMINNISMGGNTSDRFHIALALPLNLN